MKHTLKLRREIVASFAFLHDGLFIRASDEPQGPVVETFFRGYDQAFVLPNEKEQLSGFRQCLDLNFGDKNASLIRTFGLFREMVLIATEKDGGDDLVGGANFICFPLETEQEGKRLRLLSMNLNYVYVLPEHRKKGYLRILLDSVREVANRLFIADEPIETRRSDILIFIELNDPLRLTPEEYVLDSQHSGLDQMQRIAIWGRMGARIVDFEYVQPALSKNQAPDETLLYGVIGAPTTSLSSCILCDHLLRFFGISVLKGANPVKDATARRQIGDLKRQCAIGRSLALLDPLSLPARLVGFSMDSPATHTLRDLLRSLADGESQAFIR